MNHEFEELTVKLKHIEISSSVYRYQMLILKIKGKANSDKQASLLHHKIEELTVKT
jgi:hypothetical protein